MLRSRVRYYDDVVLRAFLALAVALTAMAWSPLAVGDKLRVRARPDFHAIRTEAHPAGARLTGALRDETQAPVPGRPVTLRALGVVSTDCESGEPVAITDERGRFCFLLRGGLPDRAELEHSGSNYWAAASKSVELELSAPELLLEVEVDSANWDVRGGPQRVRLSLVSEAGSNESHPLTLRFDQDGESRFLEPRRTISTVRTMELELDPAELGQPGPATLTAIVGDDPRQPLALRSVPLVLSASVSLGWSKPLEAVRPELGFEVGVSVQSSIGPVDSGWVEVSVGETKVGTAQVSGGTASVPCRFMASSRRGSVLIHARYVPDHPWLSPGPELAAELLIAEIPWWWHVPWLLSGTLAAVWIFRAWRRPTRRSDPGTSPSETPPEPGIRVVEPTTAESGWRGVVVDAHTNRPIPSARIRIALPSVGAVAVAAETRSAGDGSFALEALDGLPEGARWSVEAPEHTTLVQAVPPNGTLQVLLSSRRRSLLAHLVRWAEERGWGADHPPTPGNVIHAAREREEVVVAQWAREVEEAVFGSEGPNAEQEAHLAQKSPPVRRV